MKEFFDVLSLSVDRVGQVGWRAVDEPVNARFGSAPVLSLSAPAHASCNLAASVYRA